MVVSFLTGRALRVLCLQLFDYDGVGAKSDKLGAADLILSSLPPSGEPQDFDMDVTDPTVEGSKGSLLVGIRCSQLFCAARPTCLTCQEATTARSAPLNAPLLNVHA
eukprot:3170951-Prymnesium_polylepis.2